MRAVILIDFSSVLHPIWHQESTNPDPNATSTKVVARIRALASGQPHVALACDKGPYFRKDISPAYKATRGEPIAELLHQGEVALDVLRADGFPVWSVKGFEADDLLASGVIQALAFEDVTVQLVSGDKDILQLIQPRVTVRKLTDGSVWDDAAVFEKLGVHANQVGDFLSLCGDAADNVIGAKGVGPKKAAELLTKFGNLEDLFVALTEHGTLFTPALATNLREFEPRMAEVRSLIRLRTDVPVNFEEVFRERVPADVAVFGGGEMDDIDATMQPLREMMPVVEKAAATIEQERKQDEEALAGQSWTPQQRTDHAANALARAEAAAEAQSRKPSLPPAPAPIAPPATWEEMATWRTTREQAIALGLSPMTREQAIALGLSSIPSRLAGATAPMAAAGQTALPPPPVPVAAPAPAVAATGLAVREAEVLPPPSGVFEMQLEPRSLREASLLASEMFKSRLFSAYGTWQGVLSTILAGRELKLQAMASLRSFHILDNKPTMSADLIRGLVQRSPLCEYFRCVERTPERATWATKRKGDPIETTLTYTLDQGRAAWAKDQKAWDASAWGKRPVNMVTKSASTELARLVYADICGNMYSVEELSGEERNA